MYGSRALSRRCSSHRCRAVRSHAQPVSIAIQQYNALYATQPTLIQAAALMTMAVPIAVFLFAQRAFMRGVVVTGVDK